MSSNKPSVTVGVSGMTCGSCVNTVTNALKNLGSDVEASVSLSSSTAHVSGSGITFDSVKEAIEACGFTAGPCGSGDGAKGGKCSAGSNCTCGEVCACGDNCRCSDCPGKCGKEAAPCPAKAKGSCSCGEVCACGPNCTCAGCPGNPSFAKDGRCSAGDKCNCGDNCQCGETCACSTCSGTCGTSGGSCPAKAAGTCTCGPNCACGPNCSCAGCPGNEGKLLTKSNIVALAVVGAAVAAGIFLSRRK